MILTRVDKKKLNAIVQLKMNDFIGGFTTHISLKVDNKRKSLEK